MGHDYGYNVGWIELGLSVCGLSWVKENGPTANCASGHIAGCSVG